MTFVSTLSPQSVWRHFDRILAIPRGSKDEGRIRDYVVEVARGAGLEYHVDGAGNVVVWKPGSAGHEGAPAVVLQSHLDMVNEKDSGVAHDFDRDPLQPRRDGAYLTATGTTLGADNGIGVAAMLAIMEAGDLVHGPLDLLFTIDEETGLTGAMRLEADLLRGRKLLNLDSEEKGAVYVGCAGGGDDTLLLPLETEGVPAGQATLSVAVRGLRGGHSGIDIALQRANAIKLLARLLDAALQRAPFRLGSLEGGSKHNAIPREARATIVLAADGRAAVEEAIRGELERARLEFAPADPDVAVDVAPAGAPATVWSSESTRHALDVLLALPHGVLAMSLDIAGLVETSTNLATVQVRDGRLAVATSSRSSIGAALEAVRGRIGAVGRLAGAEVERSDSYPGWKPDLQSSLLAVVREVHAEVLHTEPELKAIHAGLECGIIGEKLPGIEMVSIGPQIEFPHSPGERVEIESVGAFYELVKAVLARLAA